MDVTDRFLTYAGWVVWVWLPPALALTIATGWGVRARSTAELVRPPVAELWLALLTPTLSLLWGAVAYAYGAAERRSHWAFHVLDTLTLLSILVAAMLTYRHRRRLAFSITIALFSIAFALLAWFVSSMSIGNDWI